jgi:hypothetical protein
VDTLHVWAFPKGSATGLFVGVASYGSPRTDVGSLLGAQFDYSGYSLNATLPPGEYLLLVYMHSTVSNSFNRVLGHNITVRPPTDPATAMDFPRTSSTLSRLQPLTISGWALDRAAPSGSGVRAIHVWAFPTNGGAAQFVGVATCGMPRPDVGAAFGDARYNDSGYALTVPAGTFAAGTYLIVVFGNSTVTDAFSQAAGATVTFVE